MGPRPHLWIFDFRTASFGTELYVSMGPRPHLSLCSGKTSWVAPELQVSVSPRPHLPFCACKTACVASELLVSMGPSPHLWFLDAKQWLFDQNNKSLWFPDITCHFCMPNIVISIRIKRLYCLQPSPVALCMQNSDFRTRITSLCGSKTPPVDFVCKTAPFGPE